MKADLKQVLCIIELHAVQETMQSASETRGWLSEADVI